MSDACAWALCLQYLLAGVGGGGPLSPWDVSGMKSRRRQLSALGRSRSRSCLAASKLKGIASACVAPQPPCARTRISRALYSLLSLVIWARSSCRAVLRCVARGGKGMIVLHWRAEILDVGAPWCPCTCCACRGRFRMVSVLPSREPQRTRIYPPTSRGRG